MNTVFIERLQVFFDTEARSSFMDYGYITPQYDFRMWGGQVAVV